MSAPGPTETDAALAAFHPATAEWFRSSFAAPTRPQALGWPSLARGESTLILAPTGSGKTLTAFLACLDRLMFSPEPPKAERCRVLYVSPLKALAVDVERNLRAPLAGIANRAETMEVTYRLPTIAVRSGDTAAKERARFGRTPTDILITTPESLYLMLTSNVREMLRFVETVIIDEIHALVPTKRGSHMMLALERLEALVSKPLQRIGLSATQRPLEEVARFLGGAQIRPSATDGQLRAKPNAAAKRLEAPAPLNSGDESGPPAGAKKGRSRRRAAGKNGEDSETELSDDSPEKKSLRTTATGASRVSKPSDDTDTEADASGAAEGRVHASITSSLLRGTGSAASVLARDERRSPASSAHSTSSRAEDVNDGDKTSAGSLSARPLAADANVPDSVRIPEGDGLEKAPPLPEHESQEVREEFADTSEGELVFRPVTIIDAGEKKRLELRIEVPVEDMTKLGQPVELPSGAASQGPVRASIWTAIHPRLLELVKAHQSTILFVNSRRIAERLAASLNELAGEVLVYAHHGSLARAQRSEIEDRLKSGSVRGLVATSSLELGIDMGAVDLVVQIEAPPSVASGMQRIGRAGHQVGAASRGVIFPKYRADLLACAAIVRQMHASHVESTRYPRNPLDILAQHLVAMVSMDIWDVDALFHLVRGAAPFAELSRAIFDGVLDMLAGRYASEEFADLRPRVTWDRVNNRVTAREGAKRIAVVNGGTIPDRGLYGVFLVGAGKGQARVGELDEEMVFESKVGETFLLGASTWRIEEITFDRVLVSPAPGEPGKMPFWRGESADRPRELGENIGRLVRELREVSRPAAMALLAENPQLDERAAENLLTYLDDQGRASGVVPDDKTLVIERVRDELGDWRVCVLTPLGGKIHAPWAMAAVARIREQSGIEAETMWTNDGFVLRFPESDQPPDVDWVIPSADELEGLVLGELAGTALFAAKFREIASRALLLPKRRPGTRAPLWQLRKRSHDLLQVASRHPSFPMLLETYRECVRDVFDLPALMDLLGDLSAKRVRVVTVDSKTPSPFAAALLFGYVANYLYDGDAPLAERRAQALSIDQNQLRELLGDVELRTLLDADAVAQVEATLQHVDERLRARNTDSVHDLLLRIGDLSLEELGRRSTLGPDLGAALDSLVAQRRIVSLPIAREPRFVAVEHAAAYRDALGAPLPPGIPVAFLDGSPNATRELVARYARTHGPFTTDELCARYALGRTPADNTLKQLVAAGRLLEGAFRPGGIEREWCDPNVLGQIRRRSLSKLRKEIEPVEPRTLGRLYTTWQGLTRKRTGLDALLDAIERLQGAPLPASIFEESILAGRIENYSPDGLDRLVAAGEIVWCGLDPSGEKDGKLAIYLTDSLPMLHRLKRVEDAELTEREQQVFDFLSKSGASFFAAIHAGTPGGFAQDTVDALWSLVWKGLVTNDTFRALRAFTRGSGGKGRAQRWQQQQSSGVGFRSRRASPPSAEGRWSLLSERIATIASDTEWSAATAQQLLTRYGVVTREVVASEGVPAGFSGVYDVFRTLEESGRIRRGYFVSGVGAMQFALPSVLDLLRSLKEEPSQPEAVLLSAVDPANPYGAALKWPEPPEGSAPRMLARAAGAWVVLANGAPAAYLSRGGRQLTTFLPDDEPDRSNFARAIARKLGELTRKPSASREGLLIGEIDGAPPDESFVTRFLEEEGFTRMSQGLLLRRGSGHSGSATSTSLRALGAAALGGNGPDDRQTPDLQDVDEADEQDPADDANADG